MKKLSYTEITITHTHTHKKKKKPQKTNKQKNQLTSNHGFKQARILWGKRGGALHVVEFTLRSTVANEYVTGRTYLWANPLASLQLEMGMT